MHSLFEKHAKIRPAFLHSCQLRKTVSHQERWLTACHQDLFYDCIIICITNNTGWAKSQYPYVGLYSSVTECPNEIILSGMTYYHHLHWFKEFVKSKHICVHFFQMKVHFRIYLIVWIVGSSQILLDCVWPFELRFYWKNESSSFSDDRDMKLNEVIHYVWSGDWVEARSALWEACRKPNYGVVIG